MPHDFLPRPDGDFSAWANHYAGAVHKFWQAQGLDETDLKPFDDALELWNKGYAAHIAARALAQAAAETKRQARFGPPVSGAGALAAVPGLEPEARRIAGFVQTFPATTNADRAGMGITVRAAVPGGTPGLRSAPRIAAEQAARLTHRLRFVAGDGSVGIMKPRGVVGAEVFVAITAANGATPVGEEHYRYLKIMTRDGVRLAFGTEHAGKTVHYLCRWLSTRGETGAWGSTSSATVAA